MRLFNLTLFRETDFIIDHHPKKNIVTEDETLTTLPHIIATPVTATDINNDFLLERNKEIARICLLHRARRTVLIRSMH